MAPKSGLGVFRNSYWTIIGPQLLMSSERLAAGLGSNSGVLFRGANLCKPGHATSRSAQDDLVEGGAEVPVQNAYSEVLHHPHVCALTPIYDSQMPAIGRGETEAAVVAVALS